ncbi:MarR family winged helix-turn-helix transcriptional regulator [Mumia sp. DW29H23]|uniref:MarR family winged helix-turn-helix transcriptional regulator n=1 Tax=Mumia sp. DW29H23 TaxID=3421241 RepID=UPI003D68B3F1
MVVNRAERRPTMTAEARFSSPGFLLAHIGRVAQAWITEALEPLGLLPREAAALLVLREHGELSQQRLGELLDMDPNYLVFVVRKLEGDGLVTRTTDAQDRRRRLIAITAEGRARRDAADAAVTTVEERLTRGISTADAARLRRLLMTVDANTGARRGVTDPRS